MEVEAPPLLLAAAAHGCPDMSRWLQLFWGGSSESDARPSWIDQARFHPLQEIL
jgi:hypothetical protein